MHLDGYRIGLSQEMHIPNIYIYILGVARYTDVTVRYDFGTTGKKINLLCSVYFHLFLTDSSANIKEFHLDVKILIINTNTIITLLYYVYNLFCFH